MSGINLGIDLDDVISNSIESFVYYARKFNKKNKILHKIQLRNSDVFSCYGWGKDDFVKFKKIYLAKVLMEASVKDFATATINRYIARGVNVFIITARSSNDVEDVYNITKMWLKKQHMQNVQLFLGSIDKVKICKDVYDQLKIPVIMFMIKKLCMNSCIIYKFTK